MSEDRFIPKIPDNSVYSTKINPASEMDMQAVNSASYKTISSKKIGTNDPTIAKTVRFDISPPMTESIQTPMVVSNPTSFLIMENDRIEESVVEVDVQRTTKTVTVEKTIESSEKLLSSGKIRILNLFSKASEKVIVNIEVNKSLFAMEENTISSYMSPNWMNKDRCEIFVTTRENKLLKKGYFSLKPGNFYTLVIQGSSRANFSWMILDDLSQSSENKNEAFVRFLNFGKDTEKLKDRVILEISNSVIYAMNDKRNPKKLDYFSVETGEHSITASMLEKGNVLVSTDVNTQFIGGVYSVFLFKKYIRDRSNVCEKVNIKAYDIIVTLDSSIRTYEKIIVETHIEDRALGIKPIIYEPKTHVDIEAKTCPMVCSLPVTLPKTILVVQEEPDACDQFVNLAIQ